MSISNSLRKAAALQEKIEALRGQLIDLLSQTRAEISAQPEIEAPSTLGGRDHARGAGARAKTPKSRGSRRGSPLAGRKRASSPSGPLAPAVVRILRSRKKPMNVRDILEDLLASGYVYSAAEPKKNLAARIYRLKGVKQVSAGLFAAASNRD